MRSGAGFRFKQLVLAVLGWSAGGLSNGSGVVWCRAGVKALKVSGQVYGEQEVTGRFWGQMNLFGTHTFWPNASLRLKDPNPPRSLISKKSGVLFRIQFQEAIFSVLLLAAHTLQAIGGPGQTGFKGGNSPGTRSRRAAIATCLGCTLKASPGDVKQHARY